MAYTAPTAVTAGDALTATLYNTYVKDNIIDHESRILAAFAFGKTAQFEDQKTSNTPGGTFTSGAWRTRELNTTVTNTISGCSLASNQITLPAGSYFVIASAPGYSVNYHQMRLYNATDAAAIMTGSNEYTSVGDYPLTQSRVFTFFTLSGTKAIEVQHQCGTTKATNGFGVANAFGTEKYTNILLGKVS